MVHGCDGTGLAFAYLMLLEPLAFSRKWDRWINDDSVSWFDLSWQVLVLHAKSFTEDLVVRLIQSARRYVMIGV